MADTLTIYSFHGNGALPTICPFCLTVQTWLRLAGVPYDHEETFFSASPSGKLPFARHGDVTLTESARIIAYASRTWGVDLDADLTPAQRATATLVRATIEEGFKPAHTYDSFCVADNAASIQAFMALHLPPEKRDTLPAAIHARMNESLRWHGIAHLPAAEVYSKGEALIDAVAITLGAQPWLLGDRPTTVDAVVYAHFVCTLRGVAGPSRLTDRIASHANLMAFIARVETRYWA